MLRSSAGVDLGTAMSILVVLHLRKQAFRLPSCLALHAALQPPIETGAFAFAFVLFAAGF